MLPIAILFPPLQSLMGAAYLYNELLRRKQRGIKFCAQLHLASAASSGELNPDKLNLPLQLSMGVARHFIIFAHLGRSFLFI